MQGDSGARAAARRSRTGHRTGQLLPAGQGGARGAGLVAAGLQMVGFAAADSGLRAGSRVELLLDENAVVLALAEI